MRRWFKEVAFPVAQTVLQVATPISLAWTAYQLSPWWTRDDEQARAAAEEQRDAVMRAAGSTLAVVLGVAGTWSYVVGRR